MINLDSVRRAPVTSEPFSFFLAENVLTPASLDEIRIDFPNITSSGIFPLEELKYGPSFTDLIEDLRSAEFEHLVEEKLGVSLAGLPLMITVRGHCAARDGRIHTDSKDKVVTGLLYLNDPAWNGATGRLRLLRNGTDIESTIAEVPPNGGTLVLFKRSDNSWHGHHPYEGERRYIMFNWLTSDLMLAKNVGRHKLSARIKKLNPFA
jgi:SM-20-related protein